jgi:hypothetical protein
MHTTQAIKHVLSPGACSGGLITGWCEGPNALGFQQYRHRVSHSSSSAGSRQAARKGSAVRRGPIARARVANLGVPLPERHARLGLDPGPCRSIPTAPAGRAFGSRLVALANLPRARDITPRSLGALGPGKLPAIIPEHFTTACQGGCSQTVQPGPCLPTSCQSGARPWYRPVRPPQDP